MAVDNYRRRRLISKRKRRIEITAFRHQRVAITELPDVEPITAEVDEDLADAVRALIGQLTGDTLGAVTSNVGRNRIGDAMITKTRFGRRLVRAIEALERCVQPVMPQTTGSRVPSNESRILLRIIVTRLSQVRSERSAKC